MELLAPAGNLECGVAAFQYGADAVYLGLKNFSARADAVNFDEDELRTLVGIAHQNAAASRNVYVTVNTLVRDDELPAFIDSLAMLNDSDIDGIIVQDWAILPLVREYFPNLELHASTQLAIHNYPGALRAKELGFKRVVLARELTLPEIERIAAIPGLETEVFIHGALCYAYSGLCLLSSVLRGTSGNRGTCEYICRNSYAIPGMGVLHPMSMKDLGAGDFVQALKRAGVNSLKIEGRKKTPLYVAAVTNYYRKLLDGTFAPGEQARAEADIRTIFSRPWTPFHLRSRKQPQITDIHTTGPRGTDVGIVADVVAGTPDMLRFVVKKQPLEKHDGLQLELAGRERPYGFPVDDIHAFAQRNNDTWKRVFVAPVDTTVEVPLPDDHPEIPVGTRIFCSSSQAVKRAYSWPTPRPALCKARRGLAFRVSFEPNRLTAMAQLGKTNVTTSLPLEEPLQMAKQPERVEEGVRKAFEKLGDTAFFLTELTVENPQGLFAPVSLLNELRRCCAEDLAEKLAEEQGDDVRNAQNEIAAWHVADDPSTERRWVVRIDKPYYLNLLTPQDLDQIDEVVFSLAQTREDDVASALEILQAKVGSRNRIRLSLPPIIRRDTGYVTQDMVESLCQGGWYRWELTNIGTAEVLRSCGALLENLNLTADWSLFVTNRMAAKELLEQGIRRVTLSPDDTRENQLELLKVFGDRADIVVYQDTVLAYSDVCLNASIHGACVGPAACRFTTLPLDNAKKNEHLLAINNHCQTIFIRQTPLDRRTDVRQLLSDTSARLRLDFCWRNYTPVQVKSLWDERSSIY